MIECRGRVLMSGGAVIAIGTGIQVTYIETMFPAVIGGGSDRTVLGASGTCRCSICRHSGSALDGRDLVLDGLL